jgi:hypothetical protein
VLQYLEVCDWFSFLGLLPAKIPWTAFGSRINGCIWRLVLRYTAWYLFGCSDTRVFTVSYFVPFFVTRAVDTESLNGKRLVQSLFVFSPYFHKLWQYFKTDHGYFLKNSFSFYFFTRFSTWCSIRGVKMLGKIVACVSHTKTRKEFRANACLSASS